VKVEGKVQGGQNLTVVLQGNYLSNLREETDFWIPKKKGTGVCALADFFCL